MSINTSKNAWGKKLDRQFLDSRHPETGSGEPICHHREGITMARKITITELMVKLGDSRTSQEEISNYFIVDAEKSGPFSPRFVLNPETVVIPKGPEGLERSALALNLANSWARRIRRRRFNEKLDNSYDGPIIVSEGDSWFQYPIRLHDVIDNLMETYAVNSLGAAGDTLLNMYKKQEYLKAIGDSNASILLLSGGGNDLVADGGLADHLESYDPDLKPADYLKNSFNGLIDGAISQFEAIFRQVHGVFPDVTILCHGYDYTVPNNGRWLGKPMKKRGIKGGKLQKAIVVEMMDRFNREMRRLSSRMPHTRYINCRDQVGDAGWYDELHPKDQGYANVADLFRREIDDIASIRSRAVRVYPGSFGTASEISRGLDLSLAQPAIIAEKSRGVSLHIGINEVDEEHYDGWSGPLVACENDAVAMHGLAEEQSFEAEILLTDEATRDAVIEKMDRAASELRDGDMFFMSVSAHGARLPDYNRDERDGIDEALCLYDGLLLDDEIYHLWGRFAPGVRILMLPDTCHSGSMIRQASVNFTLGPDGRPVANTKPARYRMAPEDAIMRTLRKNIQKYRPILSSVDPIPEDVLHDPNQKRIKARVLSISACQDDQFAKDGDDYGAFTGAVLRVWNNGSFAGNYSKFHRQVFEAINDPTQRPKLFEVGFDDPGFKQQTPFTLWANPRSTVLHSPAVDSIQPADQSGSATADGFRMRDLQIGEGDEPDDSSDDSIGTRSSPASWPKYSQFQAFVAGLGLRHFAAPELLALGGSNSAGKCEHKNSYPPSGLWQNIGNTARVLDELRDRLGKPVRISSAYRSPAYNACIKGAKKSQHKQFRAIDFSSGEASPKELANALKHMRDEEKFFVGGIGVYNTFVHIDTRPYNVDWPKGHKFGKAPAWIKRRPPASPAVSTIPGHDLDPLALEARIMAINDTKLSPVRGAPKLSAKNRSRTVRTRSPEDLLNSLNEQNTQHLQAAVNSSGVVSFANNTTPQQREDVLMSMLFAERAATAAFDRVQQARDWYNRYQAMLVRLGWTSDGFAFQEYRNWQGKMNFDKAALGILQSIATGNQLAILKSAIDALRALSTKNDERIALFDFATSTERGGNFQVGAGEASGDVVSLSLSGFFYRAEDNKRNVLFVSWGDNELDFWVGAQRLMLVKSVYDPVRELILEKLTASRKTLLADIPLA